MTLQATPVRLYYSGDGTTTTFTFGYKFFTDADLIVLFRNSAGVETQKTLDTHYTVSGEGEDSGGTVTFTAAPDASTTVVIYRDPSKKQLTDLQDLGQFPAETIETQFDKVVAMVQRLSDRLDRAYHLQDSDATSANCTVPALEDRTNSYAFWDSSGRLIAGEPLADSTITVTTFMKTLLDDANASAGLVTLGFSPFMIGSFRDDTNASQALVTLGISPYMIGNVLDDTNASQALATLGFSSFIQTLIDDTDSTIARQTLGILDFTESVVAYALAGTGASSVGTGSTKAYRWADASQTGADWTISTDSTLGTVMTNLIAGNFIFELMNFDTTAAKSFGFSIDATGADLTTSFFSLSNSKRIAGTSSAANLRASTTGHKRVSVGQVIRAHGDLVDQTAAFMKITRIGR